MEDHWLSFQEYGENTMKFNRTQGRYIIWPTQKQKENTMTDKKLYEITTGTSVKYGHKLAVNSAGKWVMELKGTQEVDVFDKGNVQEVMPHTIGVVFGDGKTYHYLAEAGKFTVGDFYLLITPASSSYTTVQVTAVDTKRNATVDFTPIVKLNTEKV